MSAGAAIAGDGSNQSGLPAWNPREWITAKQLAGAFGSDEQSAYRWRNELLPEFHPRSKKRLWRFAGAKLIFFHRDCIPYLEDCFAAAHGE